MFFLTTIATDRRQDREPVISLPFCQDLIDLVGVIPHRLSLSRARATRSLLIPQERLAQGGLTVRSLAASVRWPVTAHGSPDRALGCRAPPGARLLPRTFPVKLTKSFSTRAIPLILEEMRASRRSSNVTKPTVVTRLSKRSVGDLGRSDSRLRDPEGCKLDAGRYPFGQCCCSPFFRLDRGMPQIGQLPGASRTTLGCIGQ